MRLLKLMVIAAFSLSLVAGCSSGPGHDECLAAAKESLKKSGIPEASLATAAENACAPCKQNKDSCKPIIDALPK